MPSNTSPPPIVIDLRGLLFIDSSGLHFLLRCAQGARQDGYIVVAAIAACGFSIFLRLLAALPEGEREGTP
jgi:anti-anti-sigma regulatory factor